MKTPIFAAQFLVWSVWRYAWNVYVHWNGTRMVAMDTLV